MVALRWYSPPLASLIDGTRYSNKCTSPLQIKPQFRISGASFNRRQHLFENGLDLSCCYSETTSFSPSSEGEMKAEEEEGELELSTALPSSSLSNRGAAPPPLLKKRKRYRKAYPGENKGITEEMRFVAMKLRNKKSPSYTSNDDTADSSSSDRGKDSDGDEMNKGRDSDTGSGLETWQPSMEGFAKFLVDSKLVFQTLERIVEESDDVAYSYFRKTGLERSERLARDIEWLRQMDVAIPEPSNPGISYSKYLKVLAEKSSSLFLSHVYNMYFSHIAGGQVIVKQVSDKLLDGREMEFCRWDRETRELLKDVRDNLNRLAEHWSRDEKNKCLREATKSFRFMGQIVRLIIL